MKNVIKLLVVSTVFIFFFLKGNAQTENQQNSPSINFQKLGLYVPGKLIFKNGEVLERNIEYANPEDLKKLNINVNYLEPGHQAIANVPKERLKAFEIDGHLWKRITHKGDEQFGIVHIEGAICYYSIFRIPMARVTGDYQEQIYVRKLNEEPISDGILKLKYRKTVISLVADNEEMVAKINNKEKGYKNIFTFEKVVKEYNDWYANNH